MAQTTGAMSARNAVVDYSLDGSSWTTISGFQNKIEATNQARKTGEAFTFDGDTPIITAGKRESMKIKYTYVYTEGASDPQEALRARFEGALAVYVRWAPQGSTSGQFRYASAAGYISDFMYPAIDASNAAPIPGGFTVVVPSVTKALIP
jgi:hypothetical protein